MIVSPFASERTALEQLIRDEGHDVCSGVTCDQARALASDFHPDVVIADAQLPGLGLACDLAMLAHPERTILLCTRSMQTATPPGVVRMMKPIDLRRLYEHVLRAAAIAKVA